MTTTQTAPNFGSTPTLTTLCLQLRGRTTHYLVHPLRIVSGWGNGEAIYVTADGWVGVRLDGEKRVDEYPAEAIYLAQ